MIHCLPLYLKNKIKYVKRFLNTVSQVSVAASSPFLSSIVLLIVTSKQLVGYSYANICKWRGSI
jgi:hypothetical protein